MLAMYTVIVETGVSFVLEGHVTGGGVNRLVSYIIYKMEVFRSRVQWEMAVKPMENRPVRIEGQLMDAFKDLALHIYVLKEHVGKQFGEQVAAEFIMKMQAKMQAFYAIVNEVEEFTIEDVMLKIKDSVTTLGYLIEEGKWKEPVARAVFSMGHDQAMALKELLLDLEDNEDVLETFEEMGYVMLKVWNLLSDGPSPGKPEDAIKNLQKVLIRVYNALMNRKSAADRVEDLIEIAMQLKKVGSGKYGIMSDKAKEHFKLLNEKATQFYERMKEEGPDVPPKIMELMDGIGVGLKTLWLFISNGPTPPGRTGPSQVADILYGLRLLRNAIRNMPPPPPKAPRVPPKGQGPPLPLPAKKGSGPPPKGGDEQPLSPRDIIEHIRRALDDVGRRMDGRRGGDDREDDDRDGGGRQGGYRGGDDEDVYGGDGGNYGDQGQYGNQEIWSVVDQLRRRVDELMQGGRQDGGGGDDKKEDDDNSYLMADKKKEESCPKPVWRTLIPPGMENRWDTRQSFLGPAGMNDED